MLAIHHASLGTLKQSADHGCHLCAMFWGGFFVTGAHRGVDGGDERDKGITKVVLCRDWPIEGTANNSRGLLFAEPIKIQCGKFRCSVFGGLPLPDPLEDLYTRACAPPSDTHDFAGRIQAPADSFTGSRENLDLARFWLQKCLASHTQCGCGSFSNAPSPLPTRVIDLKYPDKPRLREIQGLCLEYLTLSYCWGQGNKLLTTRASYEEFCRKIPVDERMPKTFNEAFQVTEALGYRYLWIDALCIIQDDSDDVQREMTRMREIYQNSVLTIAAASGPDIGSGLFVERDPRWLKPCNVPITMVEGDQLMQGTISISVIDERKEPDPLSSRGWVLQEQILSTRSLMFGPYGIKWNCVTLSMSETSTKEGDGDGALEVGASFKAAKLMLKLPDVFFELKRSNNRRHNHFDAWYELVSSYSYRELTFLSDKLPAVAGLASIMQKSYLGTYSAGLWKEDLQIGLAWYVVGCEGYHNTSHETLEGGLNEEYVAPSFSWASMTKRHIQFCDYEENTRDLPAEGLQTLDWEFSYVPGPLAPFGKVEAGVLTARGYFKKALLIPCWGTWESYTPGHRHPWSLWRSHAADPTTGSPFGDVALDSFEAHQSLSQSYQDAVPQSAHFECQSCTAARGEKAERQTFWYMSKAQPVWCLLCLVREKYSHRQLVSLVLTPCDTANQVYRRIGLLFVDARNEWAFRHSSPFWQDTGPATCSQVVRII